MSPPGGATITARALNEVHLIQTLTKNWWLLALCGVFDAVLSVIYFMHDTGFNTMNQVMLMGKLAAAAGAFTIAAGIWRSTTGKCWPLAMNGAALGAFGLILNGIFGFRISLRSIALLLVVMAASSGILYLATARTLRRQRHVADGWFLGFAAAASLGFVLGFLALGFHWITLEPGPGSHPDILWFGAYFGFSAICMVVLALRLHSPSLETRPSIPNISVA